MKKLSLAVIGCVVLAGCTAPQKTTPPVMEKPALMPIVQTVVPEEPILKANETVTAYTLFELGRRPVFGLLRALQSRRKARSPVFRRWKEA